MGWIKRKIDEHVCPKPKWNKDIAVGDIWQCDECKLQWRVVEVSRGQYDQRDNCWFGQKVEYTFHQPTAPGIPVTSWRDR